MPFDLPMSEIALGRFQRLRIGAFWGIAVVLGGCVLLFHSAWGAYRPFDIDIADLIEVAGLGLIGIAILGRLWCTLYIGGRKASELVQAGPYSISRNPLYLFSTIGAAGVGAQTGSIIAAIVCAIVAGLLLYLTALREQAYLAETFGAAYEAYRKRVPMFFPDRRLFSDPEHIVVTPQRLYRTLGDGLVFFLAMPVFEFIEILQDQGILPILFRLF